MEGKLPATYTNDRPVEQNASEAACKTNEDWTVDTFAGRMARK